MRDIEEQIRAKQDQFDVEVPHKESWNHIRDEWKKDEKKSSFGWWKVAAIVFLCSSIALIFYNLSLKEEIDDLSSLGDISDSYREIELNYTNQINQLSHTISYATLVESEEYRWVQEEMKILDQINDEYRKDIGRKADQDQLVKALLDYYEKKIRLLKKLELEINRRKNEEINIPGGSSI